MKLTYAQLFQAAPTISKIVDSSLPVTLAIKLVDIIDTISPHLTAIDKFRNDIGVNYATEKNKEEFNKLFSDYLNTTTADIQIEQIPVYLVQDSFKFTVRELATVRFLFSSQTPISTLCEQN